jgi:rfaE bifunctional protein nucleotidyltransferase chain/domain
MSPTMIRETNYPALLSREDAQRRCHVEALRGGTIVFTNGVFDILHRGHLDYLREARSLGSLLIVGLNSDDSVRRLKGPTRPLFGVEDRAFALSSLRYVDHVIIFDEDTPEQLIKAVKPHILVKGGDYKPDDVVGADFVQANGGHVVILPFRKGYSTTSLIHTIAERGA